MTTRTGTTSPRRAAWRPALGRDVAMRLATAEYERFGGQIRLLSDDDWGRPTECPAWDVKALVGHVTGMAEMSASVVEQVRQMRAAGKSKDGPFVDALTAVQVAKHAATPARDLVETFLAVAPRAARGRRRVPAPVRRYATIEQEVDGVKERWTMSFLVDVVLTRDTWMHRIDLARAVGGELRLTADHDGVLVADVAAEWARRYGHPCSLELAGPAGGRFSWGSGGPHVEADAVEFCRGLSGRGSPALGISVPF